MLKKLFQKKKIPSDAEVLDQWEKDGKPLPPPHILKQKVVEEYQKKFGMNILVETGTFLGDMIEGQRNNFKNIFSIELGNKLYKKAKKKFDNFSHIDILQGDSGEVLHKLVPNLKEPALFWLDGHYSGGVTALGSKECPVPEELNAIFKSELHHIILIDDARLFDGTHDYPTIDDIKSSIISNNKKYHTEIRDDIIRLIPIK